MYVEMQWEQTSTNILFFHLRQNEFRRGEVCPASEPFPPAAGSHVRTFRRPSPANLLIFRGPPLCRLIDELHAPTLFGGRQSISKIPPLRVFQDDKVHPRTGGHFTHTFVLF